MHFSGLWLVTEISSHIAGTFGKLVKGKVNINEEEWSKIVERWRHVKKV